MDWDPVNGEAKKSVRYGLTYSETAQHSAIGAQPYRMWVCDILWEVGVAHP
jgi:hypothetical protein